VAVSGALDAGGWGNLEETYECTIITGTKRLPVEQGEGFPAWVSGGGLY
jgi:hypothetical protein